MKFKIKMNTTNININNYTKKFDNYPNDLIEFAKKNNIELLPLSSMKGQALALMSQEEIRGQKHISRKDAVQFFKNIGMETSDAIQQFNKTTGFKRIKNRKILINNKFFIKLLILLIYLELNQFL